MSRPSQARLIHQHHLECVSKPKLMLVILMLISKALRTRADHTRDYEKNGITHSDVSHYKEINCDAPANIFSAMESSIAISHQDFFPYREIHCDFPIKILPAMENPL